MIEQGIDALLRADSALMALLGSGPQPVNPAADRRIAGPDVSRCSARKDYTIQGSGVVKKMFQFDAWSRTNDLGTYAEVKTIVENVHRILDA